VVDTGLRDDGQDFHLRFGEVVEDTGLADSQTILRARDLAQSPWAYGDERRWANKRCRSGNCPIPV